MLYFFFFLMIPPPPTSTLFPYTTLFRSNVTITVNSTAAEPEQEIQVIEPLDSVSPSTPRSQTRRSDGNAQSAVLEILPDGGLSTLRRRRDAMVLRGPPIERKLVSPPGAQGRR